MILKTTSGMVFIAALCSSAGILSAEPLSLSDARQEAIKANIDIKISKEKVVEAQMTTKEKYAALFPEFSLATRGSYSDNETATTINRGAYGSYAFGQIPANDVKIITYENQASVDGRIKLQQPLFAGGRIYYSYLEAESRTDERQWDERQVVQDILLAVESAYFTLLKAEEMERLDLQHVDTLKAHQKDMEKLFDAGRAALLDVLKVKVRLAQANGDVVKSKNAVHSATSQLNFVLNRPLDQLIETLPVDETLELMLSVEKADRVAKDNNNLLKSMKSKRVTTLMQTRVAEADYYPNITLSTEYGAQRGQPSYPDDEWTAQITLDWTFWQWGGTDYKVSAARARERQLEYQIASLSNAISAGVRDVFLEVREVEERLAIDSEILIQAEENFRITLVGFEHGRKTSTDVMDAEAELAKARSVFVQDKYDFKIAAAKLRHFMGMMEKENLKDMYERQARLEDSGNEIRNVETE